eukprot:3380889-Prymnesium_polylepis.1
MSFLPYPSGLAVQKVVEQLGVLRAEDGCELVPRLGGELAQVEDRVHQLAVVVRVHARQLPQKVLRRHVEELLGALCGGRADGRGGRDVGLRLVELERLEDGDSVLGGTRPEEPQLGE